jgi:hypothetical protein
MHIHKYPHKIGFMIFLCIAWNNIWIIYCEVLIMVNSEFNYGILNVVNYEKSCDFGIDGAWGGQSIKCFWLETYVFRLKICCAVGQSCVKKFFPVMLQKRHLLWGGGGVATIIKNTAQHWIEMAKVAKQETILLEWSCVVGWYCSYWVQLCELSLRADFFF